MYAFTVICKSPRDTGVVASMIAPLLRQGDAIILKGDLAAGKTYFVQALVGALGSASKVTSPTFGLAHFYRTEAGTFLHVDAYRLSSVAEYRDLGLAEYSSASITAVEWGEKIESEFSDFLLIQFDFIENNDTFRRLTISSGTDRWKPALQQVQGQLFKELAA